jgi:dihydrofolate reductase
VGDAEMSEYETKTVGNADTVLFGRKTYQDFVGYWAKVLDNPKAMVWTPPT